MNSDQLNTILDISLECNADIMSVTEFTDSIQVKMIRRSVIANSDVSYKLLISDKLINIHFVARTVFDK